MFSGIQTIELINFMQGEIQTTTWAKYKPLFWNSERVPEKLSGYFS